MVPNKDEQDKLPAKRDGLSKDLTAALTEIKTEVQHLAERQTKEVSMEFKALMEGYVNKANESESFKVKYDHVVENQDELKQQIKQLKDENRVLSSDLDAAREALKLSESDLKITQTEFERSKTDHKEATEKIITLTEENKRRQHELEAKIRELTEEEAKLKDQLLTSSHEHKKFEQNTSHEKETLERNFREAEGLVAELKEQLELRTREIEYKDALLNQIVKQTAVDEKSGNNYVFAGQNGIKSGGLGTNNKLAKPQVRIDAEPETSFNSTTTTDKLDNDQGGSIWGAFSQ